MGWTHRLTSNEEKNFLTEARVLLSRGEEVTVRLDRRLLKGCEETDFKTVTEFNESVLSALDSVSRIVKLASLTKPEVVLRPL